MPLADWLTMALNEINLFILLFKRGSSGCIILAFLNFMSKSVPLCLII